jgi:hypothetical protein
VRPGWWRGIGACAGDPSIPAWSGDAFVQYSFEVGMDAAGNFLGGSPGDPCGRRRSTMATAYAIGQRGALVWFRTGSDVVVTNAFRLLKTT